MNAISEVRFNLTPVSEKPTRRYRKGSKHDPRALKYLKWQTLKYSLKIDKKLK